MRGFSERGKGLEAAFARKEEEAFWIASRRNRLFGVWAASRLGLEAGDISEAYIRSVIASDLEAPGDEDIIAKVQADLTAKGVSNSHAELRGALQRAGAEALQARESTGATPLPA